MDLRSRLVSFGKCHESMAGTGLLCTAAASRITGSVAHRVVGAERAAREVLRIGHPLGVMEVRVERAVATDPADVRFAALAIARTARRLMAGELCVPADLAST